MLPISIYLFLLIELFVVSYGDIKTNKIPNMWPILNIVMFLLMLILFPDNYHFEFNTFFYSLVFLLVGFVLFLLKIMGAGDTKFLFSFFLVVPVSMHESMLMNLLISTIIIGLFFLLQNTLKNFENILESVKIGDIKRIKTYYGTKFSYAPVILISWIWLGWQKNIF